MSASAQVALRPYNEAPRAVLADRRGTINLVFHDSDIDNTDALQLQYLRDCGITSIPLAHAIADLRWGGRRG